MACKSILIAAIIIALSLAVQAQTSAGPTIEGSTLTLDCGSGNHIASISDASYGSSTTVGTRNGCYSRWSMDTIIKTCLGKTSCSFTVGLAFFGNDPCYGVYKYAWAKYTCAAGGPPACPVGVQFGGCGSNNVVTCGPSWTGTYCNQYQATCNYNTVSEGDTGDFTCAPGSVISAQMPFASWGQSALGYCPSWIYSNCSVNVVATAGSICADKQTCTISASDSTFPGFPCPSSTNPKGFVGIANCYVPCAANQCKNGGTCNGGVCTCPSCWSGADCSTNTCNTPAPTPSSSTTKATAPKVSNRRNEPRTATTYIPTREEFAEAGGDRAKLDSILSKAFKNERGL